MKSVSANGVKGIICRSFEGVYFFRVMHPDGTFDDYDFDHYDLYVTIDDPTAHFYTDNNGNKSLDYDPETLGK